jgi:acetolactate synthase regulatory subunit
LAFDGTSEETAEMSTTALAPPPQTPPATPLRRYELSTTGGSEALMRVIGLIRRRGGEIVALDFDRGDRHRPTVLKVTIAIDRRHESTLLHRLAGLIDVVGVREY